MAGDMLPNPLDKPGWRLEFHDEFDGPALDTGKWLPCYLPQWSSRERSAPRYALEDGALVLQIEQHQQPWCPEFDGQTLCSSVQTGVFSGPLGSAQGQHLFQPACRVREVQPAQRTYTPQYGYFELRARAQLGPANHVSLWMIGFEDQPGQAGEIAVMEIMGSDIGPQGTRVGYGLHPWGDAALVDEFHRQLLPVDASRWHLYAIEWSPWAVDFHVDNRLVRRIPQSPAYPMQFMLGIYERAGIADATPYPKRFAIDYFRAYQPIEGWKRSAAPARNL